MKTPAKWMVAACMVLYAANNIRVSMRQTQGGVEIQFWPETQTDSHNTHTNDDDDDDGRTLEATMITQMDVPEVTTATPSEELALSSEPEPESSFIQTALPREWWCRNASLVAGNGTSGAKKREGRRGTDGQKMDPLADTFTTECRANIFYNNTWGELAAPFADKYEVKELLHNLLKGTNSLLKIIPTIAHYDSHNLSAFSLSALQEQSDGFIIKPTHTSGGVAKVAEGEYHCFKKCKHSHPVGLTLGANETEKAQNNAMENAKVGLKKSYGKDQTQYKFIPPRIIVEPLLPLHDAGLYHFWVVDGVIAFGQARCAVGSGKGGSFVTTEFEPLHNMKIAHMAFCNPKTLTKPETWDTMVSIASDVSRRIHPMVPGMVRVDLYESLGEVYFSEFTFTSDKCQHYSDPIQADRLLYALMHGLIDDPANKVTPSFVENLINGDAADFCHEDHPDAKQKS